MSKKKHTYSPYKYYIKTHQCLVCQGDTVDPHHLDAIGMGGDKGNVKDYTCVPLCRRHHTEYHSYGIRKFEKMYKINLWKESHQLLRRYFAPRESQIF